MSDPSQPLAEAAKLAVHTLTRPRPHTWCGAVHAPGPCADGVYRPGGPGIWAEVQAERLRAHAKHGDTSMESADPLDPEGVRRDIITEEWGEVAKEYNEARHERRQVDCARLRAELIQMSAMTGAWADALTDVAAPQSGGPDA